MDNGYKELLTAIIQKQTNIIGLAMAMKKAERVEGLELGASGDVLNIKGDPLKVTEALVQEYSLLSGTMAIKFCKEASDPVIAKYRDLKIPAILQ